MSRPSLSMSLIALVASGFSTAPTAAVAAASFARVWVANEGADSPTCGPIVSPCRTLNGALANVAVSGEIDVKDPGGYGPGPITITKSVSIVADGVGTAGVQAPATGGDAIDVNAPGAVVILKGLSISSSGGTGNGIALAAAASLTVENCTLTGFQTNSNVSTGNGLYVNPSSGTTTVIVADTTATANSEAAFYFGAGGSGSIDGRLTRVDASSNNIAVAVIGLLSSGTTVVTADRLSATGNTDIAVAAAAASLYLNNSVITDNAIAIDNGGTIYSYGNNVINGNGANYVNAVAPVAATLQ